MGETSQSRHINRGNTGKHGGAFFRRSGISKPVFCDNWWVGPSVIGKEKGLTALLRNCAVSWEPNSSEWRWTLWREETALFLHRHWNACARNSSADGDQVAKSQNAPWSSHESATTGEIIYGRVDVIYGHPWKTAQSGRTAFLCDITHHLNSLNIQFQTKSLLLIMMSDVAAEPV